VAGQIQQQGARVTVYDPRDLENARRIIDARNALDPARWREAGWSYRALGRP
jgi:UDPglucose 6-dehydrogenase